MQDHNEISDGNVAWLVAIAGGLLGVGMLALVVFSDDQHPVEGPVFPASQRITSQ